MTINRLNQGVTNQVLVKAVSGQTTPLLELQDSTGAVVSSIGPAGELNGIGKILQVVRATDDTNRSTTSTSIVDVTGMTISITPKKSNSSIIIITKALGFQTYSSPNADIRGQFLITNNSNTILGGAQSIIGQTGSSVGSTFEVDVLIITQDSPGTTSPVTYKTRFKSFATSTTGLRNGQTVGQMFAIEVAA
jgi:hypothetical protein